MSLAGAATRLWAAADLRARWRSLVVLGVLAGITAGLAVAAYDGAQRTGTALDRLTTRTAGADALVFGSQIGQTTPDWSKLAAEPEVATLAQWGLLFGLIDGEFGGPLFVSMDGTWSTAVDRPVVIAGRMFDPTSSDEIVVDEPTLRNEGIGVGGTIKFQALGPTDNQEVGQVTGPEVELKVVGVIRSTWQFAFAADGTAWVSPGYIARYGSQVQVPVNAAVRLTPGSDMAVFRAHASDDVAAGIPVLDLRGAARRVRVTTGVERTMLIVLAIVLVLAGLVMVGQALARSGATIGVDAPTLRAMGMTRSDLTSTALVPHVLTSAVAVVATVATAVIASRWFPVGFAAEIDPDRGFQVAVVPTLVGALAVLLAIGVVAGGAAWMASRPDVSDSAPRAVGLLAWLRRLRPFSVGLGAGMAFDARAGRRGTGARAALLGAVAAVAGVVGMVTLDRGITDSLHHPERAGVVWDATVVPTAQDMSLDGVSSDVVESVRAQPGVVGAATVLRAVMDVSGTGVPVYTEYDAGSEEQIRFALVSGRLPTAPHEVALGPASASAIGVGVGDHVTLADGTDARVVGIALFPTDVHAEFDEGALVQPDTFVSLQQAVNPDMSEIVDEAVVVRFAGGPSEARVAALAGALGDSVASVDPAEVPLELTNLRKVRTLPLLLSLFLAVLGVSAVGHALFTSVRRRDRELAVLRALGATRRNTRVIVGAQITVIATAGLLVGVPVGVVLGRYGWHRITTRVPLTFVAPMALVAVALVVPAAVLVANALAVLPGRRAARLDPAEILRSE